MKSDVLSIPIIFSFSFGSHLVLDLVHVRQEDPRSSKSSDHPAQFLWLYSVSRITQDRGYTKSHSFVSFPIIRSSSSRRPSHDLLASNSFIIGASRDSGFVVLAHLPFTVPSLPIKNFSKFHLILFMPMRPGCAAFIHSQTGSALSPLTSVLPSTGKDTP